MTKSMHSERKVFRPAKPSKARPPKPFHDRIKGDGSSRIEREFATWIAENAEHADENLAELDRSLLASKRCAKKV
jgi:hypothetical protein